MGGFTKQTVLHQPTCPESLNQINASLVHHFLGYLKSGRGYCVSSAPWLRAKAGAVGLQLEPPTHAGRG